MGCLLTFVDVFVDRKSDSTAYVFLLGKRKIKLCGNALFRNKAGINLFFPETCIDVVRCLCCDIFLY